MPAYVPPHLRNRTTPSTPSTPSTLATPIRSTTSSNNGDRSTPSTYSNGSANRTPFSNPRWSSNGNGVGSESGNGQKTGSPWETGHPGKSHFSRRPYQSSPGSSYPKPNPAYNTPTSSRRDNYQNGSSGKRMDKNDSPQPRHGRAYIQHSPAQLHVFGDSFVGPFKLIDGDSVQIKTFKGASAKATSVKRAFTNFEQFDGAPAVDLQINYIWQLANKPISSLSSPSLSSSSDYPNPLTDGSDHPDSTNILHSATETSSTGPALGPEDFVNAVVRAYTTFLEREVVHGPVGERLSSIAEKKRNSQVGHSTATNGKDVGDVGGPPKVFIAAALPPLIEDEMLPRIPEKYVERLEEDFEKQQRMIGRGWKPHQSVGAGISAHATTNESKEDADLVDGLSLLEVSDKPAGRPEISPDPSTATSSSIPSPALGTPLTEPTASPTTCSADNGNGLGNGSSKTKTPISSLLTHSPPLCTLPVRVRMTNQFNNLLSCFCAQYADIFTFIDISPAMHLGSEASSIHGEVDRGVWACPVDRTNVHPVWEPTLPLWLEALKKEGMDTDTWKMCDDAEETFKAYEIDKRRRTAAAGYGGEIPIKLRDE
ncbi:hypothetical protein I309_02922 [Cryptococcus deuterogattii LA55]|nr:hypothetical protein I309_02922 [Cryptococcus deuterogattii LA55]KIR73348.1 hypothetical protein I310_03014 [Cryptococcus deuterogattii CA1014]KIR91683.1 hypothetical protein I304_04507 [Cryptococcus deuterogattii CBS 10090]KIR99104.1 hypothetical protein L804_03726 [Cryptococcus deuterogattii 2001/935-1]